MCLPMEIKQACEDDNHARVSLSRRASVLHASLSSRPFFAYAP